MKILRFDLIAYGPFTGRSLDLSKGDHGFHLIYGPNEAGKSSALRALGDALYGVPARTPDNFIHSYANLRVGAVLEERGRRLEFVRRKTRSHSLRLADDETPLDDEKLTALLRGLDRSTFESMFGIDHATLVRGGLELASGKGEIGRMLFAAGAAISDVRALEADLQSRAAELFKRGGSVPAINKLLAEIRELKSNVRQNQLAASTWQEHRKKLERTRQQIKQLDERADSLRRELEWVKRVQAALPAIAERKERLKDVDPVRDAVILREDFRDDLYKTEEALKNARATAEEARGNLEEIASALSGLKIPEEVLAAAARIEKAFKLGVNVEKAAEDSERKKGELAQCRLDATAILKRLPQPVSLERAREIEPGVAVITEIRTLIDQHSTVQSGVRAASERIGLLSTQLEGAKAGLAGLKTPVDTADLQAAIRRAQELGTTEEKRNQLRLAIKKEADRVELDLKSLPFWSGAAEDLERIAVPPVETIEHYQNVFDDSDNRVRLTTGQREETARQLASTEQDLRLVESQYEVPTLANLEAGRTRRDLGWRAVKLAWKDGEETSEESGAFLADCEPGADLCAAYEQSVARADDLSDRLRAEAEQVQRKAALAGRRAELEQHSQTLARDLEELATQRQSHENEWSAQWSSCGIVPRTPREMLAWDRRRQPLVERIRKLREQRSDLTAVDDQNARLCDDLQRALVALGVPVVQGESLWPVLQRSQAFAKQVETAGTKRQQAEETAAAFERDLQKAQKQQDGAGAALDQWRKQWAVAVAPLGLAGDCSVAQAQAVLETVRELSQKLDDADRLADRPSVPTLMRQFSRS